MILCTLEKVDQSTVCCVRCMAHQGDPLSAGGGEVRIRRQAVDQCLEHFKGADCQRLSQQIHNFTCQHIVLYYVNL